MHADKIRLLTIFFFLKIPFKLFAQGGGPPPPGLPGGEPPLIIDCYLAILMTAGVILGYLIIVKRKS